MSGNKRWTFKNIKNAFINLKVFMNGERKEISHMLQPPSRTFSPPKNQKSKWCEVFGLRIV